MEINKTIFNWEKMPILLSSTFDSIENDIFYNFEIKIDKNTGLLYQNNIPNQEILYKYSRNSAIGNIWKNHHENFYNFIRNNIVLDDKKICEIGSGNGYLALKISNDYSLDCYEPNPSFTANQNINVIKKLFGDYDDKKYDIIIASHTFEHIVDIDNFLLTVSKKLNKNGKLILSVPNTKKGLDNDNINVFNSEHISYFTPKTLERILNKNYFQNCIISEYIDHSIFIIGELSDSNIYEVASDTDMKTDIEDVEEYLFRLNENINYAKILISDINKFSIFGCHCMTSLFIYLSKIDISKINKILDNDSLKNNSRLYGYNLYCTIPDISNDEIVLLNGASYHNEIKEILIQKNYKILDWKNKNI